MPACFAFLLRCLYSSLALSLANNLLLSLSFSNTSSRSSFLCFVCISGRHHVVQQIKPTTFNAHTTVFCLFCQPSKASCTCVCICVCVCLNILLKNHLQVSSEIAVSKSWRQSQLSEQQMLARGKSIRPKNLLAHVVGQIFCWPKRAEL